ncbi:methyltransferase domain-containing protein [uncultured Desulfobacter sp.]|uniref:class I SAM-dependent methyltransferase n=1 Tax=uncultured Desulfobacter sp. TaxID=240139 RepID=UPI0029F59E45|nr:methyltransferase domain-containing protein [uncultured Desulfobacter sp.]
MGVCESWYQSDAASVPFDENEFDVVFCQHGLQFFPDRLAALKEMYRVLIPNGRIAVSVWRALDRCPFLAILGDVLGRYLGESFRAAFNASCLLHDREEIRETIGNAGFHDINIRLELSVSRYPSLDDFLPGYLFIFSIKILFCNMVAWPIR